MVGEFCGRNRHCSALLPLKNKQGAAGATPREDASRVYSDYGQSSQHHLHPILMSGFSHKKRPFAL
jgi:hypothetical protein